MPPASYALARALRFKASCLSSAALSILFFVLLEAPAAYPQTPLTASIKEKFDLGEYQEASCLLQAALAREPQNSSLAFWLMRTYFELDMFEEAISSGERAVEALPSNSEYHLWLGRAYGRKAEKKKSFTFARKTREEFEKAVDLDPANLAARRDLMEFYLQAPWMLGGGKDKAKGQADAIAARDPLEGSLALGSYWLSLGKVDSAEAEYAKVLELKPGRIEPYFEVADFYQTRQDAGRLEAAVEAAARINPRDSRLAYYQGVVRILERKNLADAEQYLQTYLAAHPPRQDSPSQASAHVWLGRLYEEQAKKPLAASQYKAALELDPGRREALEGLSRTRATP
jgi:tetratricopeptide (TPR) repeat protein